MPSGGDLAGVLQNGTQRFRMLRMDRPVSSSTQRHRNTSLLMSSEKPRLNRETLRAIDLRATADEASRQSLTSKCVTFNAGAIRDTNAA